jgi:hypothetical protein
MTEGKTFTGVKQSELPVLDSGIYNATLTSFSDVKQGINGEYVYWNFTPEGYDFEVSMISSIGGGWRTKGMEVARRLTGKSDAVDQKWGLDLKEKRPVINWGPELVGSKCRIDVEKYFDEDLEVYKNRVVNVLPPAKPNLTEVEKTAEEEEDADFESIPF